MLNVESSCKELESVLGRASVPDQPATQRPEQATVSRGFLLASDCPRVGSSSSFFLSSYSQHGKSYIKLFHFLDVQMNLLL